MRLLLCGYCLLITTIVTAQSSPFPPMDKSPMDMSYYPANYPILKIQDKITEPLTARIVYSRPQKNGRNVFGELLEYGKVWRLGANEATEIEFFRDVSINNKPVPKGRYTMYCIPAPDTWTLIFNKDTDVWGAFKYDSNKDLLRANVPVQKLSEPLEVFSMAFDKDGDGFDLKAAWDMVMVSLPISIYTKPATKKPETKSRKTGKASK